MNGEISFRHNVINIQSLDTFIHIRGGFNQGRKDVYFVRAIGECPDFLKVFESLDGKLIEAEKSNRIRYLRIKGLPNSVEKQASEYYVSAYAEWKQGKPIITGKRSENRYFVRVLEKATRETIEKYKIVRPGISESIIRNFVIKLWYWTDLFSGDVIREWSERLTVKIVSDNIVKPQEYLFFYFATLLGFDVLLLNNRADIDINEKIRNLSSELILGSFGTAELPEHGKNTVCTQENQENKSESSRRHIDPGDRKNEFAKIKKNEKNEFPKKQGDKRIDLPKQQRESAIESPQKSAVSSAAMNNSGNRVIPAVSSNNSGICGIPAVSSNSGNRVIPAVRSGQPAAQGSFPAANNRNRVGRSQGTLMQEKTFEELAQLASSIVMIAVLDGNGEPTATGSGIMIGKKGFILTNFHVVKRGVIFAVRIEDDEKVYVTSEVIKYNPQLDLAVLRIDRELNPLPVYDGRKKLVRGQRVVAIGSPLGLFNSVSDGIISGFRKIKDVDMIQFTAPISSGSSGGAVLNMYGEIIGISTAGVDSGQNINLAVDYSNIRFFAQGFFGQN